MASRTGAVSLMVEYIDNETRRRTNAARLMVEYVSALATNRRTSAAGLMVEHHEEEDFLYFTNTLLMVEYAPIQATVTWGNSWQFGL